MTPQDVRAAVLGLFARGEAFDVAGFVDLFDDPPLYQLGNFAICHSKEEIAGSVSAFFGMVRALYHDIKTIDVVGETAWVEMDVLYWRKAGGPPIRLPVADIFRFSKAGKVRELRIFMDAAPVGDPAAVTGAQSVFQTAPEAADPSRDLMRRFFQSPAGQDRMAMGHPPKWSLDGPKWPVNG